MTAISLVRYTSQTSMYRGSLPEPPKFPSGDFLVIFRNLNYTINNLFSQLIYQV